MAASSLPGLADLALRSALEPRTVDGRQVCAQLAALSDAIELDRELDEDRESAIRRISVAALIASRFVAAAECDRSTALAALHAGRADLAAAILSLRPHSATLLAEALHG